MAAKQKHRIAGNPYNLRKKVEIPVEIQLENDSAFLNDLPLCQYRVRFPGQKPGLILTVLVLTRVLG